LSSVALNRRPDAPKCLSAQGFRDIYKDSELQALIEKESNLLDDLLLHHGSLANARVNGGGTFDEYNKVRAAVKNCKARLMRLAYKQEHVAHFQKDCPTNNSDVVFNSNKIEGKTVQASVETVEDSGIGAGDLLSSKFNDSFINCISLEEEREARQEIDSFMSNVAKAEGDSGFAVGSDTNSSQEFRIKQKGRVKTLCSP
jgi:hypothetical protein